MFIATLAIAGFPPFAGFFSKDEILYSAYAGPYANKALYAVALAAALLTSFYMFRLVFLTFFGGPRYDEHKVHVHESPKNMLVPLVILAIFATAGGWFAAPTLWGGQDYFHNFLGPVFKDAANLRQGQFSEFAKLVGNLNAMGPSGSPVTLRPEAVAETEAADHKLELELSGMAVLVALIGLFVAWWLYVRKPKTPEDLAKSLHGPYTLLLNKYYVDEIYLALIVRPLLWLSTNVLWHVVDEGMIDGTVNGAARVARGVGGELRKLQSGNTRSYAGWVVIGAVGVTVLLLGIWMRMAP
jgi:NADH-quinone oxidoreductase subunit L